MTLDGWLGIGVLGGFLAACWSYIKEASWQVLSLFIVRAKLESSAGAAFTLLCYQTFNRSPFGARSYTSGRGFIRPLSRYQVIGAEKPSPDQTVFWRGWRFLSVSWFEGRQDTHSPLGLNVTFLRGVFNLDALLIEGLDLLNKEQHEGRHGEGRFTVEREFGQGSRRQRGEGRSLNGGGYNGDGAPLSEEKLSPEWRLLKWKREEVGTDRSNDPWGALAFPPNVESVIEEMRHWKASEQWYKEKRIPWRLGVLTHGRPGSGKSSLAKAVAQELDLPIVSFDLASFSNEDFTTAWRRLMSRSPVLALIEDVDVCFDGRESRLGEEGGGLTFDCFLNTLSGVENADGVLVIITTNRIESLDPALGTPDKQGNSSRPGRIDRVVELGSLDARCRRKVAERILADCPEEISAQVAAGDGESGAQFQDRCAKIALDRYWRRGEREEGVG